MAKRSLLSEKYFNAGERNFRDAYFPIVQSNIIVIIITILIFS